MSSAVANVPVYSEAQLEQTITSYIAQGYALSNRTPTSATMFKRKEFSILWLVIGLLAATCRAARPRRLGRASWSRSG